MAPIHALSLVARRAESVKRFVITSRDTTHPSLIVTIVVLAVVCALLFSTAVYTFYRLWSAVIAPKLAARRSKAAQETQPTSSRRQSTVNWARKDSNVLWSMYINEDDLKSQFAQPSKDSRLFSIGSISTIGPLDRRSSRDSASGTLPQNDEKAAGTATIRSRAAYEQETTPTKVVPRRPSRMGLGHHHTNSSEAVVSRRQSVADAKRDSLLRRNGIPQRCRNSSTSHYRVDRVLLCFDEGRTKLKPHVGAF